MLRALVAFDPRSSPPARDELEEAMRRFNASRFFLLTGIQPEEMRR